VPEVHLSLVRKVTTEGELDRLQETLPREAFEGLFYFMAGQSYEDILREREVTETDQFDTSNFAAALERAQSLSNFMVPSDEHELNKVLNAPLEKWRVFLHPSQRKLVLGDKSGSMRVLGGAGTGKTVVAMHRAKWLASGITDANEKVLFTTFTKNLAIDIKENLASICTEEEMARIEVINLDQWAQQFLRQFDYDYEVVFGEQRTEKFWSLAISEKPAQLDLSDTFFKEEWDRVIQPQAVSSLNDYKRAKRIGRGTRLNRADRVAIWPVFEEYRSQLDKARYREPDDAYRDAAEMLSNGAEISTKYTSVIVDEAQDMGTQAFSLLRAIVPVGKNDVFICGDAHQRIYGKNKVVLSHCDIHIRGRAHKLKINYRTTDEIRKWAIGLLDGRDIDDLDGGADDNSIYKSLTHGEAPFIENFQSIEDQAGFIKALFAQENEGICVVARTNKERDRIHELLQGLGVATEVIQANRPDTAGEHVVKLATVHRVKGLEFSTVVIASVNEGLVPLDWVIDSKADPASQRQAETEERSLVYVALTRAVKKAYLLSYGTPSRFVSGI
jgi:superfamily I DNA/RNA helicase